MISVTEARNLVLSNTTLGTKIVVDLYQSLGYASAVDVFANRNFPSFPQSAMDGYAFKFSDWQAHKKLSVTREVQAGTLDELTLQSGEAIRIFTGAPIPISCDTVVMQEHTSINENTLSIINKDIVYGQHIRAVGSQTIKGKLILKAGMAITPAVVGLLAGLGIQHIEVYKAPSCILLTTGKELIPPGSVLQGAQIYESNSYALVLALQQAGIAVKKIMLVDDTLDATTKAIAEALEQTDLLLITGGVSVGDYDFVIPALVANNVAQLFHKVKQKPGKPLFVGKKDKQFVFGLPGNPGSVLTCFYQYVRTHIRASMGFANTQLLTLRLPLLQSFSKKAGLTDFLKGIITAEGVQLVAQQESYKMNGFAEANCFVLIDENTEHVSEGELVEVQMFTM